MDKNNAIKKEITMDDLAVMVQNGFLSVEKRIDGIEVDIKEVKNTTERIEAELNKKVDKFEHKDLEYRVEKLEKKFPIFAKRRIIC
jgi:cell shape-determining protein MreC